MVYRPVGFTYVTVEEFRERLGGFRDALNDYCYSCRGEPDRATESRDVYTRLLELRNGLVSEAGMREKWDMINTCVSLVNGFCSALPVFDEDEILETTKAEFIQRAKRRAEKYNINTDTYTECMSTLERGDDVLSPCISLVRLLDMENEDFSRFVELIVKKGAINGLAVNGRKIAEFKEKMPEVLAVDQEIVMEMTAKLMDVKKKHEQATRTMELAKKRESEQRVKAAALMKEKLAMQKDATEVQGRLGQQLEEERRKGYKLSAEIGQVKGDLESERLRAEDLARELCDEKSKRTELSARVRSMEAIVDEVRAELQQLGHQEQAE